MTEETSNILTIHLAKQAFTVQPFTVGQLEELHIGVVESETIKDRDSVKRFYQNNINIIAAALSEDHPNMNVETLRKMRLGTLQVVSSTVSDILVFAGIWKKVDPNAAVKEPKPGEGPAAE